MSGRRQLQPETRWPEHRATFKYAQGEAALLVVRGSFPLEAVQDALTIAVGSPAYGSALRCEIAWALRDAVRELELRRDRVFNNIRKAIAPLLDAHRPLSQVQAAAAQANAGNLLWYSKVAEVVEEEAAWWVRLHVELESADA